MIRNYITESKTETETETETKTETETETETDLIIGAHEDGGETITGRADTSLNEMKAKHIYCCCARINSAPNAFCVKLLITVFNKRWVLLLSMSSWLSCAMLCSISSP